MENAVETLKNAKEAFRAQHADVEALDQVLLPPLQQLGLAGSTRAFQHADTQSSIRKFLPSLQQSLLEHVVPTWLPTLREEAVHLPHLEAYFYPVLPPNPTQQLLGTARQIALSSYLTLVPFLASPACPPQSRQFVLSALATLSVSYPIDSMYWAVWGSQVSGRDSQAELQWEEAIKILVGLPSKVANSVGAQNQALPAAEEVPRPLIPRAYFDLLLKRIEGLLYELSLSGVKDRAISPIRTLLAKLQRQGLLNPPKVSSVSSPTPSFWSPIMPSLLSHLFPPSASGLPPYGPEFLPSLFTSLPAPVLVQYCTSLLHHLSHGISSASALNIVASIKKAGLAFERVIGPALPNGEAMDAVATMLGNGRTAESGAEQRARIVVSWVARGGDQAIKAFIERVFEVWTDAKYIKFSLFSRQQDVTHYFILALSRLSPYDPFLVSLSRRSQFLLSLSGYLSHPDASIRRLGMLVAEVVSELTVEEAEEAPLSVEELQAAEAAEIEAMTAGLEGDAPAMKPSGKKTAKRLRFGDEMWNGTGEGKEEARRLRAEVGFARAEEICDLDGEWDLGWKSSGNQKESLSPPVQTSQPSQTSRQALPKPQSEPARKKPALIQVIGDDEDDPMLGYAPPSPHSSRSASPTQEYLDEIKEDPTLHTGMRDPVRKPVYIQQLVDLLREREKPEKVERGLADGERLIRAKRGFGTELEENAELLATMAVALTESFGLEEFEEKREGLLIALVACAPKKTAPYLIEQYFDGQFSLHQRSVILSALALGGREAAGLPNPKAEKAPRIDFPTKALPPVLHQKYLTTADIPAANTSSMLEAASNDLRQLMISKGAKGADSVPEFARERRLRVSKGPKVIETSDDDDKTLRRLHEPVHQPVIPFKDVAAEYFLLPLINRFWQHFQDASTREVRGLAAGSRYRGAGTGMVLSPMALEKFLTTLGLIMHAGRHSSVYLSVLCPEALDLAATIGTRHLSRPDDNPSGSGAAEDLEGSRLEAGVVGAALELALITLDSAQELDGGRTLAMDKGTVVMGVGEWASTVFAIEERGGEVAAGAGGVHEGRVRKAAAGVVIRVSDMMEKWRGRLGVSM